MAGNNIIKQVQLPNGIELYLNKGHQTGKRWIEYVDIKNDIWRVIDERLDKKEFWELYHWFDDLPPLKIGFRDKED